MRVRFGPPTDRSPETEDAQQRPLSPGLRSLRHYQGSPSGGAWITDGYTGMRLTTFSELRLHTLVSRATDARDDDAPWPLRLAAEEPFRAAGVRALKGSRFAVLSSGRAHAISAHAVKGPLTTSSAALELPRSAGHGPGYPRDGGHHAADEGGAEQPQRDGDAASCPPPGFWPDRRTTALPPAHYSRDLPVFTPGYPLLQQTPPLCPLLREP